MKTIGLIGGMSWESSAEYYRIINQEARKKLGGIHSAECLMHSVDFAPVEEMQRNGEWEKASEMMVSIAGKLKLAGADFIVICTNTMHKLADEVEQKVGIPLLHIADAAAEEIKKRSMKRVGLLGTRFTMEEDFYTKRLSEKHGIETIIPPEKDRIIVNAVIYDELCLGVRKDSSREAYKRIISELSSEGAQGAILGCTEIGLLISENDCELPLFDTSIIHAKAAVEYALR
jgi:aspartate racemase